MWWIKPHLVCGGSEPKCIGGREGRRLKLSSREIICWVHCTFRTLQNSGDKSIFSRGINRPLPFRLELRQNTCLTKIENLTLHRCLEEQRSRTNLSTKAALGAIFPRRAPRLRWCSGFSSLQIKSRSTCNCDIRVRSELQHSSIVATLTAQISKMFTVRQHLHAYRSPFPDRVCSWTFG